MKQELTPQVIQKNLNSIFSSDLIIFFSQVYFAYLSALGLSIPRLFLTMDGWLNLLYCSSAF